MEHNYAQSLRSAARWLMKAIALVSYFAFAGTLSAQIGIPAAEGGFENATSTFPANNWVVVNPAGEGRVWRVGNLAGSVAGGTKAAYVGNALNFNGANNAITFHFYRDVVVPAGATAVNLSFYLLQTATDPTFDFIRVYTTTTANTPVANVSPGAGYVQRFQNTNTTYGSFTAIPAIDLTALAGTTVRVVFTVVSDGVTPPCPIAIDNVTLNWTVNTPCGGTPTPGNTTSTALTTCASTNFTLGVANPPTGSGVTYLWQSGPTASGPWTAFGGTTSTQTTSLTASTYYRAGVTCAGNPQVFSNPVQVQVILCYCSPTYSNDIEPICNVTFAGINNTSSGTVNGTPAVQDFTAITGNVVAGSSYTISATGNTAGAFTTFFAVFFDWDQNGSYETGVQFGSITNNNCVAVASGSVTVPLTALSGTTRMRVVKDYNGQPTDPCGAYDYGQAEDYSLNVSQPVQCAGTPPGGSVSSPVTVCSGTTKTLNATGISTDLGITLQWQESPDGSTGWASVVGGTGATTTSYTTTVVNTTRYFRLRSTCGNGGGTNTTNVVTVTPGLTPACYCGGALPGSNDVNTGIANVTFNTINNSSAIAPNYTDFTTVQTTLSTGSSYPLSVTATVAGAGQTGETKAWIDWNQSSTFDAGEEYALGTVPGTVTAVTSGSPLSVLVPLNAIPGATIMRVRVTRLNIGSPTACGNQNQSETEDYTINVEVCLPPTAAFSVIGDCANDQFSLSVDVGSYGSGSQANLVYSVNGGAPVTMSNIGLAPIIVGPFASTAVVAAYVNNGAPACATANTLFYSGCPIEITCGSTISLNHCYQNNDPRTFLFVSDNAFETVTVSFVSGTMDPSDVIRAYSGTDNSGDPIPGLTGTFANLAGVSGTSTGSELFIEIDSDGSNSCATGQQTSWTFEAECTAGCVDPDGSVAVNTNCGPYNFTIDVEVLFTGDAGTTTLRYTVNGGAPTDVPGLVDFDIENIGPFAIDDVVNVRLLHESDPTCDRNLGNFTDNNSCPTAETCINALNLGTQTSPLPGTTVGRTNDFSIACGTASTNTAPDAIYYIDVPNGEVLNIRQLTNNYNSQHYVRFGGACPGTTAIACINDDGGETAYVNWTNTTGSTQRVWWIQDGFGANSGTFTLQWTVGPPVFFPLGTCAQALLIPDPGCVDANLTISGQPNSLGNNVILESVDLILTHQYRSDLTLTLQTPGGQVLSLISYRGDDWNNFGNNGSCPTAVFRLRDSGASLATLPSANNTTGNWAPEQPLASLTGNPNGIWVLRICDDFTPDAGILRYLKLNFTPIDCNGVLGGTALPGTACNDNNACTINDVWSAGCACAGTFQDTDGDGTCNASDGCPNDPNKIAPGACGCGVADVPATYYADTDGDGFGAGAGTPGFTCSVPPGTVTNNTDLCPTDGNKQAPGACGCGVADVPATYYADTDGDGFGAGSAIPGFTCNVPPGTVTNNTDLCPTDGNKQAPGQCGCGVPDTDTDGDATADCNDGCPADPNKIAPGACGCGIADTDSDGDATADCNDGCPADPNKIAPGACGCGVADTDSDGDAIADCVDACPNDAANDADGDGYCADVDNCPTVFGQIGNVCDANPGPNFTLGQLDGTCTCQPVACSTNLNLVFQTDGVSNVGWELREQGTNTVVQSGGGVYPISPGFSISTCLPNGCYYLVVTDDGGDGFTSGGVQGGYHLVTSSGVRLIDNHNNFLAGGTSQIANGEGFCLPWGSDRLTYTSCDKLDWRSNEYIVANDNPAVTAEFGVNNANSGYEMWFFDSNGGYSFRRFHSHAVSDGFAPNNAQRACHIKINNWAVANHIQGGELLNVKVRGRVNGVNLPWGPACRFMRDEVRAQCPLTKLYDIPGSQYLSCGATRNMGPGNLVHARPVTRLNNNNVPVSANKYQFRFRIPAEGITVIKTSNTGQYWVPVTGPLQACKTYEVDVRASFDNGATWCTDFIAPALTDPWGDVCLLTTGCGSMGGGANMVVDNGAGVSLYPNPNRGDQLFLNLEQVQEGVNTVSVDIYDTFGKRVSARTIAVADGFINTVIDLNGELAAGMYVVNITAGDALYTERLVIQP